MVLNEITKGMSNAAEQIDENFKKATIVDSGTTDRGSYIKFGNGLCVQFIKFNRETSGEMIDYIIPLPNGGFSATISSTSGTYRDGYNVTNSLIYPYSGGQFKFGKGRHNWEEVGSYTWIATIWGML